MDSTAAKADCSKNIFKPAQSRMPKRWVADDEDKGQCWAAKSTDGWSNREKWREKRRRPQITEPGRLGAYSKLSLILRNKVK